MAAAEKPNGWGKIKEIGEIRAQLKLR